MIKLVVTTTKRNKPVVFKVNIADDPSSKTIYRNVVLRQAFDMTKQFNAKEILVKLNNEEVTIMNSDNFTFIDFVGFITTLTSSLNSESLLEEEG